MSLRSALFVIGVLAALVFVPPVLRPRSTQVRCIDEAGRDTPCARSLAQVEEPDRSNPGPSALWTDLAYAAAAAGPLGCAVLLGAVAVIVLALGLWVHGLRCALRRLLVAVALGMPAGIGLLYSSCFLDGRMIALGPEAQRYVPASLHNHSDRSTGMLSPRQLMQWHYRRGFRVLCVSDGNRTDGARQARQAARAARLHPSLLVMIGEEWHGNPDLVLLGIRRDWRPGAPGLAGTVAGVRAEGGASVLAHPWSKVLPLSMEEMFQAGVDGVEVVNGVIHGGARIVQKATHHRRAMLGVVDYKYGPHVNALTLLPAQMGKTSRGVVEALRTQQTLVLYAVPGGALSGDVWHAGTQGTSGAMVGLRTLLETPRKRRASWYPWLVLITLLWWAATRPRKRSMSVRAARFLFAGSCTIEFGLPVSMSWQVRAWLGTLPIVLLLALAALAAVPLLAASHTLAGTDA